MPKTLVRWDSRAEPMPAAWNRVEDCEEFAPARLSFAGERLSRDVERYLAFLQIAREEMTA